MGGNWKGKLLIWEANFLKMPLLGGDWGEAIGGRPSSVSLKSKL